jgi:TonB family protein
MNLKLAAAMVLSLLLWSTVSAQEVAREVMAEAALDVAPGGQVAHVQFLREIPEVLARPASEVMTHWRFEPVRREGRLVGAKTYARVKVQVVKLGEDRYGVQVLYRSNGPRLRPTVAPDYPLSETNHGEGRLLAEAVVQPDGTLSHVEIVESHFSGGPREKLFRRSVMEAMQRWHADPEAVDGQAVATRIQIPITFCLGANGGCSESLPPLKLWHPVDKSQALSSPTSLGEAVAVDSPLKPSAVSPGG